MAQEILGTNLPVLLFYRLMGRFCLPQQRDGSEFDNIIQLLVNTGCWGSSDYKPLGEALLSLNSQTSSNACLCGSFLYSNC